MRVVLVAETFLPQMNGVVGSVLQVLRHLERRGHEALVIAPRGASAPEPAMLSGARLAQLPSMPTPRYPELPITLASTSQLETILRRAEPDVVHLASPFALGWSAQRAAERLGIPTIAVYQTDIPGYLERYGLPALAPAAAAHVARLHQRATRTLAPSSAATSQLTALGVDRIHRWARGVDGERFRPERRSDTLRARLAPDGAVLLGYVGRLAPEKKVEDLAALHAMPGTRLVVIGDGPSRAELEARLPDAAFLGHLGGEELATAVASLDVFVHPGEHETFCQSVQEALASGVPVVATGVGGPVDLVESSRTGWLYRPGDLADLRTRVQDLVGDAAKRRAFAAAARDSVAHRTWSALGDELLVHYSAVVDAGPGPAVPSPWRAFARRAASRRMTAPAAIARSMSTPTSSAAATVTTRASSG